MHIEKNQTFSHATLNAMHLLDSALPYMNASTQERIRAILTANDIDQAVDMWHNEVWNELERIAPEGTYFGTLEGDGSHFGWFELEDEEAECAMCDAVVWSSDLIPMHYGQIVQYVCGTCYDKHIDPDTGKRIPQDDDDE